MISPEVLAVLVIALLLFGIFLGHYIAFVMGGMAIVVTFFNMGPGSFFIFINRAFAVMDDYILIAIPLFLLMANFLDKGGIAERLFDSLRLLFGNVRGGVAIAVVVVSTLLGACTGIVGASVVTMGLIALPLMLEYKYDTRLSCGVIAAGGCLGILIPPSIMLIFMSSLAEVSVGRVFAGAIIPGLVLSALYIGYILIKAYFKPEIAPAVDQEYLKSLNKKQLYLDCAKNLVPAAVLILGVLGSIFAGVATPTEAAGIGAFLAFILMIVYGKLSFANVRDAVIGASQASGMIMFLAIGGTCFASVFMSIGADKIVADLILGLGFGKWGTFIIMMLILFVMGMVLDWMAIVLICFPVFLPMADILHFDRVWFVVVLAVMLQDSFLTPPLGGAIFYLRGVAPKEVKTSDIYWGVFPFWRLMELGLIITVVFPKTVTWLPSIMFE